MSVSLGGATTMRFVYCNHDHDEGDPCNERCHHDTEGCRHDQ